MRILTQAKFNSRDPDYPETYREVASFAATRLERAGIKPLLAAADTPGREGTERYFHNFQIGGTPTMNVVGVRRAANPTNEAIVVIAHLDHIKGLGGANDNASGSATLLAVARELAPQALDKNVIFVLSSAEEKGLVGARKLIADRVIENAGFDVSDASVINFDMTGAGPADEVEIYAGNQAAEEQANPLYQSANRVAARVGMKVQPGSENDRGQRIYTRSDHYAFALSGRKKAIMITGGLRGPYHDPADTPEKLTDGKLANIAQFAAELIRDEAGVNRAPAGDANALRRADRLAGARAPELEAVKGPTIELPSGWRPLGVSPRRGPK